MEGSYQKTKRPRKINDANKKDLDVYRIERIEGRTRARLSKEKQQSFPKNSFLLLAKEGDAELAL